MCFKNLKTLIEQKNPSPRAKNLYFWLLGDAEEKQTDTIWFKQTDLAEKLNISQRTLQRCLKELVDTGMIVKKDEKHEKKFPVYLICHSGLVPESRPKTPDMKVSGLDSQAKPGNDKAVNHVRAAVIPAPAPTPAPTTPIAEPTYTPPPIPNVEVAKDFRCKYLIKLHKTKTLLSIEQRSALTGEEHISLIEDSQFPFNIQDILRDYGQCWKVFYSSLGVFHSDIKETSPSIQQIIYREIKKTMWLLHDDPLWNLNEVLDIENSIHSAASEERLFKRYPNYPFPADMEF